MEFNLLFVLSRVTCEVICIFQVFLFLIFLYYFSLFYNIISMDSFRLQYFRKTVSPPALFHLTKKHLTTPGCRRISLIGFGGVS